MVSSLLELRELTVEFQSAGAAGSSAPAVRDVSFSIGHGEVLGLVGESGSGKSVTSLALMRLLAPQATTRGEILFTDSDSADGATANLLTLPEERMRSLRGSRIAMLGAAEGFPVTLCVPENVSAERKRILQAYGANILYTDPAEGSDGAIRLARELAAAHPNLYFYANQYSNDANWRAHYQTTANEIWEQTNGRVTHFVAMQVDPEEVEFLTYDENKLGVWAAFHLSDEYKKKTATGAQQNGVIHIEHQQLDTTLEKSGYLVGKASTTLVSRVNGLRVVPLDLFHTLRVRGVTTADGQALSIIQEDKNNDADFYVVLPKVLAAGEQYTITTTYSGKEAVSNEGNGNYFPIARDNWYPSNPSSSMGEFTTYDMVVVDNARKMIGKTVDISVTSVLQTTAGKMIFGKWDERVTGTTRSEPPRVPSTPPSPPITPSSAPEVRKVPLVE